MTKSALAVVFLLGCSSDTSDLDGGGDAAGDATIPDASSDAAADSADAAFDVHDEPIPCTHNAQCVSQLCVRNGNCDAGTCSSGTIGCPGETVCGCDGKSYSNPCDALQADIGIAYIGTCE